MPYLIIGRDSYFKYIDTLASLKLPLEFTELYEMGFNKYKIGDYDRALIIFSFCALAHDIECMMSAAYIWEKNLTTQLSWRFESCASYYYMQAFLRGRTDAGIKFAHSIKKSNIIDSDKIGMQNFSFMNS